MPRNVLLMTGTITPLPGLPSLARTDPKLRLQDYQAALTFYSKLLNSCFDAIVFAENSNTDLSPLIATVSTSCCFDKIEFISFYGLDYPPAYGRGYGEFRLVDYAIEHSKLISTQDVIWKVTGRYIIENIRSVVESRPPTVDLYCNMRNYPYRHCELYLLGWTHRGYEAAIKGVYHKLGNDILPHVLSNEEASFRNLVDHSFEAINIVPRFKVLPVVRGVRGWDNKPYRKRRSFQMTARQLVHILIPSLWI